MLVKKDVPGFIGNRLLHAFWKESISMVESGIADPEDIDLVAKLTFGLRGAAIGPLENMDLVGLDLILAIHEYLLADLDRSDRPSPQLRGMVEQGTLGMKTGRGFYDWSRLDPGEVGHARDREIIRQLKRLRAEGAL